MVRIPKPRPGREEDTARTPRARPVRETDTARIPKARPPARMSMDIEVLQPKQARMPKPRPAHVAEAARIPKARPAAGRYNPSTDPVVTRAQNLRHEVLPGLANLTAPKPQKKKQVAMRGPTDRYGKENR